MLSPESSLRSLYRFRPVRGAVDRRGPAYWRLPRSLRGRVQFERNLAALRATDAFAFAGEERVDRARIPHTRASVGHRMAAMAYRLKPPVVAELRRVWLVGRFATPVTSDGKVLLSPFRDQLGIMALDAHDDVRRFVEAGAFRDWPAQALETPLWSAVGRLEPNYFHWTVETLAQLEGVDTWTRRNGGHRPDVLLSAEGPAFRRASLSLLEPEARIIEWDDRGPLAVERLIVVTTPGNRVALSPRSLRWTRHEMLRAVGCSSPAADPANRIFVARRPGGWRSIVNSADVESVLQDVGYAVVYPDDLPLPEQIRRFATASVIVGQHGAGLTNCLYAPGAAVVELHGGYGGGEYFSMCRVLQQPYHLVRCRPRGDDLFVDIDELRAMVTRLR